MRNLISVLYICPWLNEAICRERGVRINPAAGNRGERIAQALKAGGADVCLLSSATSMRPKWRGSLFHPRRLTRVGRIPVVFAFACGLPYLSSMVEVLSMVLETRAICRKFRPAVVLAYNYYPATLAAALVAKWGYGARMVLEVEDVCLPRWTDWLGRGDRRPVQQLVGWWLLKLGVAACDLVLVPSRRFLSSGGITKKHLVVSGCISVPARPARPEKSPEEPLRVLISGKLDREQGVWLVLQTVAELLGRVPAKRRLEFNFCGSVEDEPAFQKELQNLQQQGAAIVFHGLVGRPATAIKSGLSTRPAQAVPSSQ